MALKFCSLLIIALAIGATICQYSDEWPQCMVPQRDGTISLENIKKLLKEYLASENLVTDAEFILFTKQNPTEGVIVSEENLGKLQELFNPTNPTRFLVHGWMGNRNSSVNSKIRPKYLARGAFDVFVVDWSSGGDTWNYIEASKNTRDAGKQTAAFIDLLNAGLGLDFETTYLIGHSLGAHVVGHAGKYVKRGRINTIFGLDPALPLFFTSKPEKRLSSDDALYVETIHTDAGVHGFVTPIGDASFYPNWGTSQPGCEDTSCSHNRVVHLFAESLNIVNEFDSEQCKNIGDILLKSCQSTGKTAKMGGDPSNYNCGVSGVYYLPTNAKNPYAVGRWI